MAECGLNENSLRLVLLGKTGVGKSAAGNAILGKKEFKSSLSDSSITKVCKMGEGEVAGKRVVVVDTPGLFDTELSNEGVAKEIVKSIQLSSPGPHAFLLVLKVGRSTEEEKKTMQIIQEMFGEDALKYMMVLFTHRDCLDDDQSIEDVVKNGPIDFKQLVESCGNRFHAINGKDLKDREQIKELLEKVENMVKKNDIPFYASEFYEREKKRKETEATLQKEIENLKKRNEEAIKDLKESETKEKCEEEMKKQPAPRRRNSNEKERPNMSGCEASAEEETGETEKQEPVCGNSLRLVLLGKTGVGKSAAGNAILAKKEFKSSFSDSSVTKDCARGEGEVAGRRVVVVDTPGLFDTKLPSKEVLSEIVKCIQMSPPGPHAFLLVLKVGRYTEEEQKTMQIIQEMFGEDALKYMMVLFTYRDCLDDNETIEDFVNNGPTGFKKLVESCGNRFHAINGRDLKDQEQIKELLEKIENMVKKNDVPFYASEFYKREKKRKETEATLQKEIKDLEEAMDDLEKKKNKEIDDLKKKNEEAMDDLKKKKNKEIDDLKKEYKKAIEKLQQEKGCCIS